MPLILVQAIFFSLLDKLTFQNVLIIFFTKVLSIQGARGIDTQIDANFLT